MVVLNVVALILVIVGALNWGSIGFFNYNVISAIFGLEVAGDYSVGARAIFAIVGLAGLWALNFLGRVRGLCCCDDGTCRCCGKSSAHKHKKD